MITKMFKLSCFLFIAIMVSGCSDDIDDKLPLIARFSASPTSGVAPLSVNFDASGSISSGGTITAYNWDFGDGQVATGKDVDHVYASPGTYDVSLVVNDDNNKTNQITKTSLIFVQEQNGSNNTINVRVSNSNDDAEEKEDGSVSLTSTDLELVTDQVSQHVGIRFRNVSIPTGSIITKATIQFTTDETDTEATSLIIRGHDVDDSWVFRSVGNDISDRAVTSSSVNWSPSEWDTKHASESDQQTPDISSVLQEIVERQNWSEGNSIAVIISGTGQRTAEAYDGEPEMAALLTVDYRSGVTPPDQNKRPVAAFSASPVSGIAQLDVAFDGTQSTDPDGSISLYEWNFGDGQTATGKNVNHTYTNTGTYSVTLKVTDNENATDTLTKTDLISVNSQVNNYDILEKGPYLIYPGINTQMQLLWQLDRSKPATIKWGTDTSYSSGSFVSTEYGSYHQHKHTITNLVPGTQYFYSITLDNGMVKGSFFAAPDTTSNKVKLLAYGDTRTNEDSHNSVMSSISSEPAEYKTLLLHSGDWVNNGDSESDWMGFFGHSNNGRTYKGIMDTQAAIPIHGVQGNHDTGGYYKKYWPYPYHDEHYWSFDYGPVHIVVVDQYSSDYKKAQMDWLKNDLATTQKEWKIVMFHEPGWSAGGHGNDSFVQQTIQPILVNNNVDLVLCGHNHYYARAEVNGIFHITCGGGGAPLYSPQNNPNVQVKEKTLGYCKISVDGKTMEFDVVNEKGILIDSIVVSH